MHLRRKCKQFMESKKESVSIVMDRNRAANIVCFNIIEEECSKLIKKVPYNIHFDCYQTIIWKQVEEQKRETDNVYSNAIGSLGSNWIGVGSWGMWAPCTEMWERQRWFSCASHHRRLFKLSDSRKIQYDVWWWSISRFVIFVHSFLFRLRHFFPLA